MGDAVRKVHHESGLRVCPGLDADADGVAEFRASPVGCKGGEGGDPGAVFEKQSDGIVGLLGIYQRAFEALDQVGVARCFL